MEIKAAEISSVIKDQISNFDTNADVAEVGTVFFFIWNTSNINFTTGNTITIGVTVFILVI